VAFLSANENIANQLQKLNFEHALVTSMGENGYFILGTSIFLIMSFILYRIAVKPEKTIQNQ
jgi:hypothetical protein